MIKTFKIQRFKCFANQEIKLSNLTLLAGGNATGKSTVIQALLLLYQATKNSELEDYQLSLNGSLANLGTVQDILYSNSQEDSIAFEIMNYLGQSTSIKFSITKSSIDFLRDGQIDSLAVLHTNFDECTYLNAERLGPRLLHPINRYREYFNTQNVGIQGEYTAYCLALSGNDPIPNLNLIYPSVENGSRSLKYQTELWMRRIIPNLDIEIEQISQADQVRIGLRNRRDTNYWRPTNTGFGISYSLPIVVAALLSKPGAMLIVENPEAHLHPASQSEMGQFLARVAATGVQVVVETHSDHILNGVRKIVARGNLAPEEVSFQFFRFDENNEVEVITPKIDENGLIDQWPDGFFDQFEKDLLELM